MTLRDFTLSNARRFYSSMGNPSDMKGLIFLGLQNKYNNNDIVQMHDKW